MTNPTPHGQVPEALNQLFEKLEDCIYEWSNYVRADDAPTTLPKYTAGAIKDLRVLVAELYHRATHVQKPAEIEHVAGDVSKNGPESNMTQQPAPSAASAGNALPEGWVPLVITHEGQYPEEVAYGPQILMDRLGKWLRKYFDHVVASKAQPYPTAQAAESVLEDAGGANWQDISTAPKDGTRFVAVGQNYGLDSEAQHTCIAQWLAGCWVEVSDWNGASKLKYLTLWMPLPPLPGSAARKQGGV